MLFLLNKTIVQVEAPELHLANHWRRIGCGDPTSLLASEAVSFAVDVVNAHLHDGLEIEEQTAIDLAALLIAKTGANAALFTGMNEARLNVLDPFVLESLQIKLGTGEESKADTLWTSAA